MVGVQRSVVSVAAGAFQKTGLITLEALSGLSSEEKVGGVSILCPHRVTTDGERLSAMTASLFTAIINSSFLMPAIRLVGVLSATRVAASQEEQCANQNPSNCTNDSDYPNTRRLLEFQSDRDGIHWHRYQ